MANAKYLEFELIKDTGKTKVYAVKGIQHGQILGWVAWYGPWRKYVFSPANETVFDVVCLIEITSLVTNLMEERKRGRSEG